MRGVIRRFTLMEMLIAVVIFLMVSVSLFTFSNEIANSWSRISIERNRMAELLSLDRTVDSVLSNAIPFMWRVRDSGVVQAVPFIVAESGMLRIAYMHKLNEETEGAIRFVEFALEDNGDLCAVYSDRPFIEWGDLSDDRVQRSVLARDVESLSFLYADFVNDVSRDWSECLFWREEWETEESQREDIPLAIQMRVKWKDGREESWLRRTMGNSYRERYGKYDLPLDNGN